MNTEINGYFKFSINIYHLALHSIKIVSENNKFFYALIFYNEKQKQYNALVLSKENQEKISIIEDKIKNRTISLSSSPSILDKLDLNLDIIVPDLFCVEEQGEYYIYLMLDPLFNYKYGDSYDKRKVTQVPFEEESKLCCEDGMNVAGYSCLDNFGTWSYVRDRDFLSNIRFDKLPIMLDNNLDILYYLDLKKNNKKLYEESIHSQLISSKKKEIYLEEKYNQLRYAILSLFNELTKDARKKTMDLFIQDLFKFKQIFEESKLDGHFMQSNILDIQYIIYLMDDKLNKLNER